MQKPPKEILWKIFDYLPRYYQRKCQLVCKLWYESALLCLKDSKKMHGYAGIREASQSLTTASGRHIHQLMFMTDIGPYTGPPIKDEEFLELMSKTPNLRVLHFVNVNPIYFLIYLKENPIELNSLEFISVPRVNWSETADLYFKVAYIYRKTINSLKMEVSRNNYSFGPSYVNFLFYLKDFPNLRVLDVRTHDTPFLELGSLLNACPGLEELSIKGPFETSTLEPTVTAAPKTYTLYSLKVDHKQVGQIFLSYMKSRLPHLGRLCLCETDPNCSSDFFHISN